MRKYNDYEFKEFDNKYPVTIFNSDRYFFNECDLVDYINDMEEGEELQLMFAEPNYPHEFDADDYYCDILPEDFTLYDANTEFAQKVDELNKYINEKKPVLSWSQGIYRTQFKKE